MRGVATKRLVVGLGLLALLHGGWPCHAAEPARELVVQTPAGDEHEMVFVAAGEFAMGSSTRGYEERLHSVYLSSYYIDRFEVTNGQYQGYMTATGAPEPSWWGEPKYVGGDRPIVGVTYSQAGQYCQWAGLRLPTEAEWEKAARGTDGRSYAWGDGLDSTRANYGQYRGDQCCYPDDSDGYAYSAPVGSYPGGVSPYGAHDMTGNVQEMVSDWYDVSYYLVSPHTNPQGPETGAETVLRGGGWATSPTGHDLTAYHREALMVGGTHPSIGFRCARGLRDTGVERSTWGGVKSP